MDRREMLQMVAVTAASTVYPRLGSADVSSSVSEVSAITPPTSEAVKVIWSSAEVLCRTYGGETLPPLRVAAVELIVPLQGSAERVRITLKSVVGPSSHTSSYLGSLGDYVNRPVVPALLRDVVIRPLSQATWATAVELRGTSSACFGQPTQNGGEFVVDSVQLWCDRLCPTCYVPQRLA